MSNCGSSCATGDVSGNDYLGGLVGYIDEFVEIEYSFAAGTVSGEGESFGGLVGDEDEENEISNSYFTDSDHNNDFGTLEEDGASAFYHASHDVYDDWNFSEDWYIDEGESYPYFQWNTAPITEVWVDDDYQEPCEEEGECDEYGSCDEEAQSACNNNCEESCGPDEECAETCSNNCQSQHCEPARYCSDDGHTWNRDCFDDIEDAMEKIVEGGAIHVASGEYDGFKANKTGVTVQGEIGATVNDDSYYVNGIDAGILVNAPNVTIKGMTIDGNDGDFDAGIYIYDYEDKEEGVYGVRIEGNTIHVPSDYSCECGSGMAGIMARSDEGTPTVIINNIITYSVEENGNGDTSSLYGITLYGYNDPTYQVTGNTVTNVEIGLYITGDDLTGVVIQDNQFSNNEGGIMVNDGFERVTINNNAIFDNEEYGVVNDDYEEGPMLNAARNWWGDETGPSHEENPGGEGDQISDGVNFMPYYVNSTRTTLSDGSNAGAAFTSETEGRAELPPALTEVILNSSTVLDLSEQVETVDEEEGEIVLGGETFDWDDFPIKDLEGESTDMTNLDETLTIGDQEVELGAGIVLESGTDGENVVISNSEYDTAEVSIPDGTAVLAPAGCDFQIQPPTPGTASGDAPSGFSFGGTVIEVGSSECVLLFDQPMIIEIDGVFTNMAYRPTGSENWINIDRCGGTYNSPSTPAFPGECYTSNGIDKTKVYTYHLTGFSQTVSVAGGGGSAPSMKKPNSITIAYFLPYRGTAKSVHLVDESVSLQQSEGIFTQPVELEEIYDHYKVEISMGTGVTDLEGNAYLGMITSPEKVSASKMKLPGEFDFKNAVKVQATDGKVLIFDKEITVVVPVDVTDKNERNLKVFAYNADLQELKLIGKGGRVNKSDDVITVKSNYLGTFVIMDTKGGDLTAYMEEEFKAAAPKEETVEVVRIPDVLEQPIPQFSDTTGHWAEKYIDELRIRGVVEGKEQDKFAPETGIKLSQLQEISQKAFGVNVPYSAYRTIVGEVLSHENRDLTRPEALKVMLETAGVALTIPEKSLSFRDVLVGAWYEKYIKYAQGNGLIHGLGNELFGTEKPITRAETTKVVAKLWEMIEKEGTFKAAAPKKEVRIPAVLEQPIPPFKDTKDHFAGKYIEELRIRGVIEGKEKDEFAPEEGMKLSDLLELSHKSFGVGVPYPAYEVVLNEVVSGANRDVTRAEALRIVLETSDVDIEIPEKRLSFSDVMVDSWYEKYISYAQGNGLIYGVSKDNFGPEKTITRAEVAKIIAKLWEMMGSK